MESCGQEIKENNDNVWSDTPDERCGQNVRIEERGRQRSGEWNVALEKRKIFWVFMLSILKKTSSGELLQLRQSILKGL